METDWLILLKKREYDIPGWINAMLKRPPKRLTSFKVEITLVLIIKFVLLFALWVFFFVQPVTNNLTPDGVARALLNKTDPARSP